MERPDQPLTLQKALALHRGYANQRGPIAGDRQGCGLRFVRGQADDVVHGLVSREWKANEPIQGLEPGHPVVAGLDALLRGSSGNVTMGLDANVFKAPDLKQIADNRARGRVETSLDEISEAIAANPRPSVKAPPPAAPAKASTWAGTSAAAGSSAWPGQRGSRSASTRQA